MRPHHLLCLLTYVGKGYSPDFVANYDRIAARLCLGESILVVDGPDDVCGPVLDAPGSHCRDAGIVDRDRRAAVAVGTVLGRPVDAGATLTLAREALDLLRDAFSSGAARGACGGCEWSDLCTAVAGSGYADARVNAADAGCLPVTLGAPRPSPRPRSAANARVRAT